MYIHIYTYIYIYIYTYHALCLLLLLYVNVILCIDIDIGLKLIIYDTHCCDNMPDSTPNTYRHNYTKPRQHTNTEHSNKRNIPQ